MFFKIAVSIFLVLGILNPIGESELDVATAGFILGFSILFVTSAFKRNIILIIILLLISWLLFGKFKNLESIFVHSSLIGTFLAMLLSRIKLTKLGIWILILVFVANSWAISGQLRNYLTSDIPYNNDPGVLLKTYKLIENGQDYYKSFKEAQLGRFALSIMPKDIWGWRLPTIFYIWKLLPGNALSIYFLYLLMACCLLYVSYQIGKRYLGEKLGFISPYLLLPYLHFGARDQMFLETEWWSVSIFIFAIYFLIKTKLLISTVLLSLTLLIREVYLLPIGLMLIYSIFKQRRLISVFLIPIISFAIFFLYHIYRVNYFIDAWGTLFTARTVNNGIYFLQQTLAFASWEYLLNQFRPFLLLTLAAAIGCLYILKVQKKQEVIFLLLAFLPFPIAFLRFGTTPFNDYWGLIYIPTAIILAPTVLIVFKKNQKYLVHSSPKR